MESLKLSTPTSNSLGWSSICRFFRADEAGDVLIALLPPAAAGLKTYLISGRKLEPHSYCSCTLEATVHEHTDTRCPPSSVNTPDGAPTLGLDSVKVSARWRRMRPCDQFFFPPSWKNSISQVSLGASLMFVSSPPMWAD